MALCVRRDSSCQTCLTLLIVEYQRTGTGVVTECRPVSRRASLKDLLKSASTKAGLLAKILLRKGRLANVVEARDRFIREAVLEQGYLASRWPIFVPAIHPT